MKGLLQRADRRRKTRGNRSNTREIDPVKVEIYSEIDRMVDKLHAEAAAVSTEFSVIKNDSVIPLMVIIGSIIVLFGGGLFFLSFYNSKEKTILTTQNRFLSAESKILAAVKAESEEQLEIRDQRIQSIQTQLSTAIQDRNQLKADTERTMNAREEELKKAMKDTLETEKAKLMEQGLSSEDIQKRITETSNRLEAENQVKLDEFRTIYEKELKEKELAMSQQIDEYQRNLDQSLSEQNRLQDLIEQREEQMLMELREQSAVLEDQKESVLSQLREVEDVSAKEHLVSSQILESYRSIENKIAKSEYEDALAEIANLENFLKQDSVLELSGIKERLPVENFVIATLRNSISMGKTIKEVFPREKADLNADINKLESRILSQNQLILKADLEQKDRNDLILDVSELQKEYSAYMSSLPENTEPDQDEIIDLLGTKVILKQIVSTEPVKSQYPELLDQLELYFSTFGDNQKEKGRTGAFDEINSLISSLKDNSGTADRPWEAQSSSTDDFRIFLDNLTKLLN